MNREALDVVVATPPGAGRSCLGRWFSSSHRLLDAASAAALYRDFIMHYLLATPTWTRTWKVEYVLWPSHCGKDTRMDVQWCPCGRVMGGKDGDCPTDKCENCAVAAKKKRRRRKKRRRSRRRKKKKKKTVVAPKVETPKVEPKSEPKPAPKPAVVAQPKSDAADEENTGVAVMDLKLAKGIDESVGGLLNETIISKLDASQRFSTIISGSDMRDMIDLEAQKSALGCEQDSCLAELGGALGVPYMMVSNLGRFGGQFILNIKIVSVEEAKVLGRVNKILKDEAAVLSALPGALQDVVDLAFGEEADELLAFKDGCAADVRLSHSFCCFIINFTRFCYRFYWFANYFSTYKKIFIKKC